ncbi:unnamed protein product [Bemisia tabaci]|uniref:Cytochrome P450 n=1 Tax=Bemisia tabaci TaxID=7038 RepID=A0A9P0A985_BEMTA|nr:unnamed protein product [Bemisia tabaci]
MDFLEPLSSLPALLYVPLLVGSLCLVFNYLVYSRRVAEWRKSKIPFLEPSFLIGHKYFWSVGSNSAVVPIDRIYRENKDKDLVAFFIATMPVVLVRSPALIKQIFAKQFDKAFETGLAASHNDKIAQHTLTQSTDKDVWKSDRNKLSPMFATARFSGERFAKIRTQITRMWTHVGEAHLQGRPINMKQVALNFSFDSMFNSFIDLDTNSYEKKEELLTLSESLFEPGWCRLLSFFAQTRLKEIPALEAFKFIPQTFIDSLRSVLQKQMYQRRLDGNNKNDLIDLLIGLNDQDQDKKVNSEMDVTNEMIGLALSILSGGIPGMRSIVTLASSTVHILSLHSEHQERIRQEVEEVMKKHNATEFTYEVVRDLQFLEQCLRETARLYPNNVALMRVCTEDFMIADHSFKKGERFMVSPYSVHRDPAYFENPNEFDPDRFSPRNRDNRVVDAFLGFGKGPRKCPGNNVGFLLLSALVGSLVHKYQVRPHSHMKQMDAYDFHARTAFTVHKDDVLVDVVPREVRAY